MIEDKVFERIQQLCQKQHLSLYRLAQKSELPYSSISNIIHRRTCPTVSTIEKLCKGFNITPSEFFDFVHYPLIDESLSEEEDELIRKYRSLSLRKRKLLQAYIDGLSGK